MPQISCVEIIDRSQRAVMAIRKTTTGAQLSELIQESYNLLGEYFEQNNAYLSDMPYVKYFNMDMDNLDVEIGFPVKKSLPEKGEIKAGVIPEGKYIFGIYRGPYQQIEELYDNIMKFVNENKLSPLGSSYEFYLNGGADNIPEQEYLTIVEMPVL